VNVILYEITLLLYLAGTAVSLVSIII